MAGSILFVLCCCLSLHQVIAFNIMREKFVKVNRFIGFCEGKEDLPMGYYNVTINSQDKKAIINAKLIVKRDLGNQIGMSVALIRCKNIDNPDTCEDFKIIKFNKMCDLYNSKGPWSNFFAKTKPAIHCPIKAGNYTMEDVTIDTANNIFPAEGWIWQVTVNGYDLKTKEPLFCHFIEIEII